MSLGEAIELERAKRREQLRQETLVALRAALRALLPSQRVIVFGSLVHPGRFHAKSDVDIALFDSPSELSEYRLQAELEERLRRPVDIVLLKESRLHDKILREGLEWIS